MQATLTARDPYFTILVENFTKHILAEEHKIMVLKPANKYQFIRYCHDFENIIISDFQHQPFLYRSKENNKLKRRDN